MMTFLHRFLALFRRAKLDREMDEELRAHLERETERNIARGLSPDEARFAARRAFGGVDQVKEHERDVRGWRWLDNVSRDLRFTLRSLQKAPGFTATAVLVLALGIGACTAVFSVANAVLFQRLPYDEPEQLVRLWEDPSGSGLRRNPVSGGAFDDWRQHSRSFQELAALGPIEANLTGTNQPERLAGAQVSANFFELLRVPAALGRTFRTDEEQAGRAAVVVLSHAVWQQRFGGSTALLGQTIALDGQSHVLVGVLPRDFHFDSRDAQFWTPFAWGSENWHRSRENHRLRVYGRLASGVTIEQARAELNAATASLKPEYPFWKRDWGATMASLHESLVGNVRPVLLMVLAAVAFVLLIVCANVANLMLARGAMRQRELTLRAARGASRRRLIQQLLTESLVLTLAGATLGVVFAFWGAHLLVTLSPPELPRLHAVAIDRTVLLFSLGISVATGVLCGLAPATNLTRSNVNEALKEGGRSSAAGAPRRLARGLVTAEVALAVVLVVSAGLFLSSLRRLATVDPGIDPNGLLTLQISLPDSRYPDGENRARFFHDVVERVATLPGVEAAGAASSLPLTGASNTAVKLAGQPNSEFFTADYDFATPQYFQAAGIPLHRGRLFTTADDSATANAVIVNEAFVRHCLADADPIGRRISLASDVELEIVGVVGNVRERSLARPSEPHLYRPMATTGWHDFNFLVRANTDLRPLVAAVRQAVLAVDSDQPVANVRTMRDVLAASVADESFMVILTGSFAAIALTLAALAVFGVVSCGVIHRTREIGVRMALGARPAAVLTLVVRQGMTTVWIGLAIGLAASFALSPLLRSFLFEISPPTLSRLPRS